MRRSLPLLAAFSLLGVCYSIATPIFETPDELQHYAHVNYIARYRWFPPLGEKPAEHLWDQQTLQAPLFYWTAAALTAWVDTSDFSRQAILQPKANIGDANLPGKKNAFLHGPEQNFPYRNTTLAVHICRWLSVLLGAGTVLLTYFICRLTFDSQEGGLPFLAAASLAFIPQFLFISASCSNDPAITFTSTLVLFSIVWLARNGVTPRRAALFGFALGLMALSKLIGSMLAIVAFGLLVIILVRQLTSKVVTTRRFVNLLAVALATFVLTAGWWYARNQSVYGDPLALAAFLKFVGGNLDVPPMSASFLWDQFRLLRFSTWGLFGHISVLMQPAWIYTVFDVIALAGALGFGIALGRGIKEAIQKPGLQNGGWAYMARNQELLIVIIWLAAVLAIAARWFAAAGIQGRLIFPGLPAAAILWAGGLQFVSRRLSPRTLALVVSVPLAIFAVTVIPAYLLPAYSPPPVVDSIPYLITQTDIRFGDEIALRGYTVDREQDILHLTFYWEAVKTPAADYTVAVRLVRPDGSFWLDYVNYPGMGTTLPTIWGPGELRRDDYVFDLNRFPVESAPLSLIVGFFDPRIREMRPVTNWSEVHDNGWARLGEVIVDRNP